MFGLIDVLQRRCHLNTLIPRYNDFDGDGISDDLDDDVDNDGKPDVLTDDPNTPEVEQNDDYIYSVGFGKAAFFTGTYGNAGAEAPADTVQFGDQYTFPADSARFGGWSNDNDSFYPMQFAQDGFVEFRGVKYYFNGEYTGPGERRIAFCASAPVPEDETDTGDVTVTFKLENDPYPINSIQVLTDPVNIPRDGIKRPYMAFLTDDKNYAVFPFTFSDGFTAPAEFPKAEYPDLYSPNYVNLASSFTSLQMYIDKRDVTVTLGKVIGNWSNGEDLSLFSRELNTSVADLEASGYCDDFPDLDTDGDGIKDNRDLYPNDNTRASDIDLDADGIDDLLDGDIDGDGVINEDDTSPYGYYGQGLYAATTFESSPQTYGSRGTGRGFNSTSFDSDGDGVMDSEDAFVDDNQEWLDTDSDGIGNNADANDDGDDYPDYMDDLPLNSAEWLDTDGDGIGNNQDNDDDNDGVSDHLDRFPLMVSEWLDTDRDGIGNNIDRDDDGDLTPDMDDLFPLNATDWQDRDLDGIGDNADIDSDGDGVLNSLDAFPLNPSEWLDTDNAGVGDNADNDDDNDDVLDINDAFPLDASESVDTDGDGIGNNADLDDDGDGVNDTVDTAPLDPTITGESDQQIISVLGNPVGVVGASTLVEIGYTTSNDESTTTGIGFRIHFNSALMDITDVVYVLDKDLLVDVIGPFQDSEDHDNDASTDQYYSVGWASLYGDWPNEALPAKVLSLRITIDDEIDIELINSTPINFSSTALASGYEFSPENYDLELADSTWDFDGSCHADALTDGLILLRAGFDLRGEYLISNVMHPDATLTAAEVEARIEKAVSITDIDGSGGFDALTDGLLLLRYLFDFRDSNLVSDVLSQTATRTSGDAIVQYIEQYMPDCINDTTPPVITSTDTAVAIDNNSGEGQIIYTATAYDGEDNVSDAPIIFSLSPESDPALYIDWLTGEVTLTTNPDYETQSQYGFAVVATDAAGNSSEAQSVTLEINDVKELDMTAPFGDATIDPVIDEQGNLVQLFRVNGEGFNGYAGYAIHNDTNPFPLVSYPASFGAGGQISFTASIPAVQQYTDYDGNLVDLPSPQSSVDLQFKFLRESSVTADTCKSEPSYTTEVITVSGPEQEYIIDIPEQGPNTYQDFIMWLSTPDTYLQISAINVTETPPTAGQLILSDTCYLQLPSQYFDFPITDNDFDGDGIPDDVDQDIDNDGILNLQVDDPLTPEVEYDDDYNYTLTSSMAAVFTSTFGGEGDGINTLQSGDVYTFPTESASYGGWSNDNASLYPLSFGNRTPPFVPTGPGPARIAFCASAPVPAEGETDTGNITVTFGLENDLYPNNYLQVLTDPVNIFRDGVIRPYMAFLTDSTNIAEISDGSNVDLSGQFNSLLMFINQRDVAVTIGKIMGNWDEDDEGNTDRSFFSKTSNVNAYDLLANNYCADFPVPDSDGDRIKDNRDLYPNDDTKASNIDLDNDGIDDLLDPDIDGDEILNLYDIYPYQPSSEYWY
ncbi:hypothetical protein N9I32_04030 [Porticoccaceae bacterium]|nr:hypothetical protein [Porticoccaceae bacterium]